MSAEIIIRAGEQRRIVLPEGDCDLCIRLTEEGASAQVLGAVHAVGETQLTHRIEIRHEAVGCQSNVLCKYVVDDRAHCSFIGRVVVPQDMQRTESAMLCAALLGSSEARMQGQPVLEIYADDVKCSHGCTVGQLGDAALFYMQQRCIPRDQAEAILKEAFLSEVTDIINQKPQTNNPT